MGSLRFGFCFLCCTVIASPISAQDATKAPAAQPPGVVIDRSPDPEEVYVGCPAIAVLPSGEYVASHSWFGPGTTYDSMVVFSSSDRGRSWRRIADIQGQWWSSLFYHDGALYLFGVSKRNGDIVIRRSTDGGHTWTEPRSARSGLLLTGSQYHCAPVPVVVHKGRIWRAFEERNGGWGTGFKPLVLSAPLRADLLDAENWTVSNRIAWGDWPPYKGWLEGNVVVTPGGELVDILRVHEPTAGGKAAVVEIADDGRTITFDPERGFIDLPGGCKKFTIRFDPKTRLYWTLTNWIPGAMRGVSRADRTRNTLALACSPDLQHWDVRSVILHHPDTVHHGFQYVDWLFDGDDLIAVSRTAFGDAHNCHDANYLTFHRVRNFRERSMADSVIDPKTLESPDEAAEQATYQNPILPGNLADPAVIRHDGVYYLYATGEVDGDNGTRVYTSNNLVDWKQGPVVFRPGEPHVWAPDVYHDPNSGRFYLYYTVDKTVGVAEADSPLGPFETRRPLFDRAIDAHLFRDEDGKLYLYYVQLPGFRISVQPMANPTEPDGEPRVILEPKADWETRSGRVTEGPWIIKREGRYYLLYSGSGANTPDYAVGYATSDSPLGPFMRAENSPIIARGGGVFGPGHGCAIRDAAGQWWHVYHQKENDAIEWRRFIAIDPLWFDDAGRLFSRATRRTRRAAPAASP